MAAPKDLASMSRKEFDIFLSSFDYVISDCDGVLWLKEPLPGSGSFIKAMKDLGKKVYFISNNSLKSSQRYIEMFDKTGIEVDVNEELFHPARSFVHYLKSISFNKKIFPIMSPEAINTVVSAGFKCVEAPLHIAPIPDYEQYVIDDPEVGAVLMDTDFQFNWGKLSLATTYLKRPDVLFLCGATDRYIPIKPHVFGIGPACFNKIVQDTSGREPIVLAKPSSQLVDLAQRLIGFEDPKRVLFIGDMFEQDVGFGKAGGFQTLLVLTSFTLEDFPEYKSRDLLPDYYAKSLGQIMSHLEPL